MNALSRFAILAAMVFAGGASAQDGSYKIIDVVSGYTQKAIQAAMPEIARKEFHLERYQIVVAESTTSFFVVLKDPSTPIDQGGILTQIPAFEVEVGKESLQVIRAHFLRDSEPY